MVGPPEGRWGLGSSARRPLLRGKWTPVLPARSVMPRAEDTERVGCGTDPMAVKLALTVEGVGMEVLRCRGEGGGGNLHRHPGRQYLLLSSQLDAVVGLNDVQLRQTLQ